MKTCTLHLAFLASLATLWLVPCGAQAPAPTGVAMTEASRWTAAKFGGVAENPPKCRQGWSCWPTTIPCNAMPAGAGRCGSRVPSSREACTAMRTARSSCACRGRVTRSRQWSAWTATSRRTRARQHPGCRGPGRQHKAFKSAVLREGMAGVPVSVKLEQAQKWLGVDDGGTVSVAMRPFGPMPRSSCKTAARSGWRTCR